MAPPRPKLHRLHPQQSERATRLRRDSTFPERLLWSRLRRGQLAGIRFRRQHGIGPYIADFCCASAGLIVELDGRSHDEQTIEHDEAREQWLRSKGLRVLRFTNDEILADVEAVVRTIAAAIGLET